MYFDKLDEQTFLIRLEKGEEIINSLKQFARQQNIDNALITAIGSVENPTLAHYKVDSKKYTEKELSGVFELTSLLGSIGISENTIVIHPHVTISDEQMNAFGGHLVKALVSATVEITIQVFKTKFEKTFDEAIGLKLWKLSQEIKST